MNEDIYAEWLVKRKDPWWTVPAKIGMILAGIFAFGFMVRFSWGFVLTMIVGFGIFYFWRFLHVEYEYVFVTNELSIDKIYTQQIRKNALKIEMSSVESVEPTNTERNKYKLADKNIRYEDYSSGVPEARTYTVLYAANGATHLLVFEPDEKVLKAMRRCSPHKVHTY